MAHNGSYIFSVTYRVELLLYNCTEWHIMARFCTEWYDFLYIYGLDKDHKYTFNLRVKLFTKVYRRIYFEIIFFN